MKKSEWKVKNARRCDLIRKKIFSGPLTEAETSELEILQKQADEYVTEHAPMDFSVLEELERRMKNEQKNSLP